MEAEFWHKRWKNKEIEFHKDEPNSYLTEYWKHLNIPETSSVFVPLCGKSNDLLWLADQGHNVVGVELSEIAVQEFFNAAHLSPKITKQNDLLLFETPHISIYCGDYFSIKYNYLSDIGAFYDRGSLVALPPQMRTDYAKHLDQILPSPVRGLLVTMEYNQELMPGPPFCVKPPEVRRLFKSFERVEDMTSEEIEFRDRKVRMRTWELRR
jgi:thiopurine S-methyltransferase